MAAKTLYSFCRQREADCSYGTRQHVFVKNLHTSLYGSLHRSDLFPDAAAASSDVALGSALGSVFNLDFSPEEDFLVAVLSDRSFHVYDPRTRKRVHCRRGAHDDSVNCVSFVTGRQFATCSDDCTIRLWDLGNLRAPLAVLRGHHGWVKNVEYDRASNLLFSVAFDDVVRFWDLENLAAYAEEETDNDIVTLGDVVRMRLAPDGSKMFVTARDSRCLVIHEFDGKSLQKVQNLHEGLLLAHHEGLLLANSQPDIYEKLSLLPCNRPSILRLCGRRATHEYRIVMSAAFHPSGDFVAMRHTDIGDGQIQQELTSLFDLRQDHYAPLVEAEQVQHKYLAYIDDNSPRESSDYIKEICFSDDGRVLASPQENGVRLLSLDPQCTSPDVFFDDRYHSRHKADCCPNFEEVLSMPSIHQSPVLTCKFAHYDLLIATGSLAGTVAFSAPQL